MTGGWKRLAKSLRLALDLATREKDYPEIVRLLAVAQEDCVRLGRTLPRDELAERLAGMRAAKMTLRAIGAEVGLPTEGVRQILAAHSTKAPRATSDI